jgi:hypothetical protein
MLGKDWQNREFTGFSLPIKIIFTPRDHDYSTSNLRKKVAMAEAKKYNSTFYLTLLNEKQNKD